MNKLIDFSLENGPYFKKPAKFKFTKGITFVHGRNLHRNVRTVALPKKTKLAQAFDGAAKASKVVNAASNGSGKSLLFSVIPNLMFNTSPVIQKNAKQAAGTLYEKNTVASLRLVTTDGRKVRIQREGSKVKLFVNGEDTSSRVARQEFAEYLDITEQDFFSLVYLDSRRPNAFQLGTSADRMAFITNLYRLGSLDTLRTQAGRALGGLHADKIVLENVSNEMKQDAEQIKKVPADIEDRCEKTLAFVRRATQKSNSMAAAAAQLKSIKEYKSELAKLKALPKGNPEAEAGLKEAKLKLDKIKSAMDKSWNYYQLADRLEELEGVDETLLPKAKEAQAALNEYGDGCALDKPKKPGETRVSVPGIETTEQCDARLEVLMQQMTRVAQELKTFLYETKGLNTCPTCKSPLSEETKQNVVRMYKKEAAGIKAEIDQLHEAWDWLEYDVFLADWKKDRILAEKVKAHKEFLESYSIEDAQEKISTKAMLAKMEKPKHSIKEFRALRAKLVKKVDDLEAQVDEHRRYAAQLKLVKTLKAGLSASAVDSSFSLKAKEALDKKLGEAVSSLPKLEAARSLRKTSLLRFKKNKRKAETLKESVKHEDSYRALMHAYSSKGVKMLLAQKVGARLEANLNKYASHIFAEKFEFKIEVTETQFHVWAIRRNGLKKVVSDVRHLSGAESRLFNLLLVLSILPTLPAKRRFSALIMDEPEVGMDAETLEAFTKKLLPALAEVVPSVVIITPKNDYVTEGARVVTVVKDKGEATLIEGSFDENAVLKQRGKDEVEVHKLTLPSNRHNHLARESRRRRSCKSVGSKKEVLGKRHREVYSC